MSPDAIKFQAERDMLLAALEIVVYEIKDYRSCGEGVTVAYNIAHAAVVKLRDTVARNPR